MNADERNTRYPLGLVAHEPHMNGHIAIFRKEAEGQRKVILAAVDDATLVDDDILAAWHGPSAGSRLELASAVPMRYGFHPCKGPAFLENGSVSPCWSSRFSVLGGPCPPRKTG